MQENLLKKLQTTCHYSVNEIEKYIKQLESNDIEQVIMPTFDCFVVVEQDFRFFNHQNIIRINKNESLDILYYDLGIWNYIHEDYCKANDYFSKIKNRSNVAFISKFAEGSSKIKTFGFIA